MSGSKCLEVWIARLEHTRIVEPPYMQCKVPARVTTNYWLYETQHNDNQHKRACE